MLWIMILTSVMVKTILMIKNKNNFLSKSEHYYTKWIRGIYESLMLTKTDVHFSAFFIFIHSFNYCALIVLRKKKQNKTVAAQQNQVIAGFNEFLLVSMDVGMLQLEAITENIMHKGFLFSLRHWYLVSKVFTY